MYIDDFVIHFDLQQGSKTCGTREGISCSLAMLFGNFEIINIYII